MRTVWLAIQGRIQDLGRRVRQGVWGCKFPIVGQGESPCRRSVGQVPQKLMIFCKLYYNDVIWKKAKQYLSTWTRGHGPWIFWHPCPRPV